MYFKLNFLLFNSMLIITLIFDWLKLIISFFNLAFNVPLNLNYQSMKIRSSILINVYYTACQFMA